MVEKVGVIGLGYVGLPVAIAMSRAFPTVGFDINLERVNSLSRSEDLNGEHPPEELRSTNLSFTHRVEDLRDCTFFIVAVPTPVDDANQPDFSPLVKASELVGSVLQKGAVVVYESTVYPGATEKVCIPILESKSGLKAGVDFKIGYSPERINPGDKEHTFEAIKKVVAAQDVESLDRVANTYGKVVKAGVFRAGSIKIAEAAKVLENTQRDLNIALMNELAFICDRMEIDTLDVLEAASTKWNFLRFYPGLVGGHCIGVDPYYLTHKAEELGYIPQVILAGRRVNDSVGEFIAQKTVKTLLRAGHSVGAGKISVIGLTFKENCRDIRNSKSFDIIDELLEFGAKVQISDPLAKCEDLPAKYQSYFVPMERLESSVAVIFAVGHRQIRDLLEADIRKLLHPTGVLVDVKGVFPKELSKKFNSWRL
jgi:UDP-N-acetyl-D-glucosamine/UDP-N-acetyl-D-galactosamine dehydrogenase